MHEKKLYLTWVEMGHHALAHGSTSLSWLGSNGLMRWEWMRGRVGGLRGKGIKASMGSITIGK